MTTQNKPASHNHTLFLSLMALIVSVIALALIVLGWQQASKHEHAVNNLSMQLSSDNASNMAHEADLKAQVQEQGEMLRATQNNVIRLLKLANDSNRQRSLSQVAYLINLANLYLNISHDTEAALNLLTLANKRIIALSDPDYLMLQKTLTKNINQLKKINTFNLSTLIIKLDSINESIQNLSLTPPTGTLKISTVTQTKEDKLQPWYKRLLHSLSGLKSLVIISHHNNKIPALLPTHEVVLLKQNISGKILQTEWAALHQKSELYEKNLTLIAHWIALYFHNSTDTKNIIDSIEHIKNININPTLPNIDDSLSAINQINNQLDRLEDQKQTQKQKPTQPTSNPGVAL